MKYLEALKVFNKNKEWCSPRKGTADHAKVMLIMKGNNTQLPSSSATSMATTKSPSVKSATRAPSIKSNVAQGSSIQSFKAQTIPKPPKPPKPSPARVKELKAKGKALIAQRKADATAVLQGVVRRKIAVRPAKSSTTPQIRSSLRRLQIQLYNDNLSQTQIVNGTTASSSTGIAQLPFSSSSESDVDYLSATSIIASKKPSVADMQFKNAKIIQRFLKNKVLLNKNNLERRINRFYIIRDRLDELEEKNCLTKKMFGTNEGYTMEGFLNLERKMGTSSQYGTIYLTSLSQQAGVYPIASKVMEITTDNEAETKLNIWITKNLILEGKSKHFVMMFKTTKCPFYESQNKRLRKEERLVDYNELCDGDMSSLMKTDVRNDEETLINLAFQALIAIATYQNRVGFAHKDTHHGNFLYQNNNEVGYYHYQYKGSNFYIKSCKYNVLIYDFGLSDSMDKVRNDVIFRDYIRILHAFYSKQLQVQYKGWIDDIQDRAVGITMYSLRDKFQGIAPRYTDRNADVFQDVIDKIFKTFRTDTNIFITRRPPNVINQTPFIIGKVEAYPNVDFKRSSNLLQAMMRR